MGYGKFGERAIRYFDKLNLFWACPGGGFWHYTNSGVAHTQCDGQQAREEAGAGLPVEAGDAIKEGGDLVEYFCTSQRRGGAA